ncbi:ABC-2 type transport system permease protein [Actinokineospora alba]|uniref:ABC-2 type transport system permease protein n=1 Tax=Actinokineospora alba TaxID=504798 RepID=A0A1H0R4L9_9PSEU|nr:hypothetical protein [Actinokineospora alba]TDP70251.1 ABC-2 type transport system permease protein [Actinokineospora alba]SDI35752.1 ABC-2 type transport system permease protein [Actinokineospora alba]SDP24482.1 ABC-2 type transport system permease protein [Actinokineospora alba]
MNRVLALARVELVLLLRNKTAAALGLAMPLLIGVGFALTRGGGDWAGSITMQLLVVHGLTVYISATTALVARRQDLSLKRLRSGEAPEPVILAGVMAPMVVLGLVQGVLLPTVAVIADAPMPRDPVALAAAIVGGTVVAAAAALATASFTATPETAQLTTTPLFAATFAGAMWALSSPTVTPLMLAAPGGATAALVRAGVEGGPSWGPVGAMAVWTVAAIAVGRRYFRWEPRA